jgi:hypothetical protein
MRRASSSPSPLSRHSRLSRRSTRRWPPSRRPQPCSSRRRPLWRNPSGPCTPEQAGGAGAAKPGHPGIGIAGFICGLVGLILSITIVCWFIGLPLAIVGAVLGALGVRQANEKGAPKGLSMAGMICGIVGVVTGVVITVLVIVL